MDDKTFDQKTAQDWITAVEKPAPLTRDVDIYPMLNQWIKQNSPKTVLDIGCGQGICSGKIDLSHCQYVGIEPSAFLLKRAKELYVSENRAFLQGDAYNLPVADSSFDAAFSVLVWHLLSDLKKAAEELSRVLKKGGHFLVITANPAAFAAWKDLYKDPKVSGKRIEGTMQLGDSQTHDVLHIHEIGELKTALQDTGLEITKTETFRSPKVTTETKLLLAIYGLKL